MTLRNFIGMYSSYVGTEQKDEAEELLPIFQKWNPDTIEDMAVLAKFFEDHGFEEDAMKRGEAAYRFGGGRLLQKIGFQGYADLQEYFYQEKKRARGRHAVKKARVKKYMRALRKATGENDGSEEELSDDRDEMLPLDPLTGRPRPGLFRTRKSFPRYRPETFLPDEIPGTKVPMEAVDHVLFQKKLNQLANDYPEELKAARAQHREIVASFQRLEQLSDSAEDGDREATLEWISIARELIEEFSTFDLFYYNRRKPFTGYFRRVGAHNEIWKDSALMVLAVAANNVEDGEDEPELRERPDKVPDSFYGVHFDKWLDMFTEYAILLARYGEDERCFNTIEVASQSNIFYQSRHYHHQLQLCRLSCGIVLDDSLQCSSAVRWLMRTYPFGSDLFRLYGAVNRLCSIPTGFATGPSLKVFLRYIKTMDFALLRRDQRQWFNFRGSDHVNWMAKAVSTNSVEFVKDHDPAVFTTYAHVLMCGGSYTAALNYYFRAFAIIPEDPLLNLSIGVAYIQHAMKRLSENRQYQTQQGLSFIYRYYELRTKQNVKAYRSEAEFNLGRIWHALGLVSQAIPAYERCIKLSTGVHVIGKEGEDGDGPELDEFATEAAFALQSIYALSGDFQAARKITEGSLVIE
jgi:general transcription factor 3C polypeptide 3 (transcription factor C subunit 4)